MKALMALALTALCLLALLTVRMRNSEVRLGYEIARLECAQRRLSDQLLALESEVARKTAAPYLMRKAVEMKIILHLNGFGQSLVELVPAAEDENVFVE